ncbi:SLBB domain-containing protein [Candidatus Neomarinimicrobiota bacterium]
MKYIFTLLFFIISIIFAQSESVNIQDLIKQYPQLSNYATQNTSYKQKDLSNSIEFDFIDYTEQELLILDSLGVLSILLDTTKIEGPGYFGYKFFNNPDNFAIFDNIPIPGNYLLGPGDQLIISIWGATQLRSRHLINREGVVFIDGVGQINLTGMNITTAENVLRERYSEVYSTLKGKNPSTFLSMSIGQLKSNNISFVGEVNKPGIHAVHPFSDITTALLQVGGVDTVGSLRNIHVIRDEETVTEFDFYEFLTKGKTSKNARLINGDVIFVPVRQSTIEILGEINRPGIYEAKNGESIAELIHHAGGLTPKAQPRIEIYKLLPPGQRTSEDYAYNVSYIDYQNAANESAFDLIKIRVLSVPEVIREVSILGRVKTPGNYAYEDSMKILDLFKIAGGLDDETFRQSIYTKEAGIIRQVPNSIYPERISIDLDKLIEGQFDQNILLENRDIVLVRENIMYANPKYITISGQVNVPGKYIIQKKEETLEDIITRAGGFSNNAYINGLRLYRDSTQVVLRGSDIFVAEGDSVIVPEAPGVIKIFGQVQRQGVVQYVKGKPLSYYIERAGGFTNEADKKRVVVNYANGDVRLKKKYLFSLISISPPVLDGSTIYVYRTKIKPPFNTIQFLSATASAATSVVTLYLLYDRSK